MFKIISFLLLVFLCAGCRNRQNLGKVDVCQEVELSARQLFLLASYHRSEIKRWPAIFQDLEPFMKRGNVSPENFMGGAKSWKFRLRADEVLEIEYVGAEGKTCVRKVFDSKWALPENMQDMK